MQKLKVLFLAANPQGTTILKLDEEIRAISEKIRASEFRDSLDLFSAWAVRPDDLLQMLNQYKPHIVHFSGHGNEYGEIVLCNQDGTAKPVSSQALTALFKTLKDNIQLVVLNACYSRQQAEAVASVIDCVVGMSTAIGDRAAISFAASFYRAIGFGRTIQEAFDQGITSLLLESIAEDKTPDLVLKPGVIPEQFVPLDILKPYADRPSKATRIAEAETVQKIDEDELIQKLSEQAKQHTTVSLLYSDIDGLLGINKVYGVEIGDEVLRIAEQLHQKAAGEYEIFRIRGDQFVIILPYLNAVTARNFARKTHRSIINYDWTSIAPDLFISCTFCVARHRGNEDGNTWLSRAIAGVKSAKTKGSNQVVEAPLVLPGYYSDNYIYYSFS